MFRRPPAPRHASMKPKAVFALPLLVVLGCMDTDPPTGPGDPIVPQHPAALLVDGSTGDQYAGFLLLPPLVASPNEGGQSALPGLAPHVEVCLLDTSDARCAWTGTPIGRSPRPRSL